MPTYVKSIALIAALVTSSPRSSSMAFTTTTKPSQRGLIFRQHHTSMLGATSSSSSSSSSSEDDGGPSSSSSSWPLTSSSQDERLGDTNDLPRPHGQEQRQRHHGPSISSSTVDDAHCQDEPRSSEFLNLEPPPPPSALRLARLESEAASASSYVKPGTDAYWDLKDEVSRLEGDLTTAIEAGVSDTAIRVIKKMLRDARSRDPEYVYGMASNAARIADGLGRTREYDMYVEEMRRTRRVLPQFNLEGLWVGKYGSHGFEMINVTYTGDRLVAYKVTGDRNIPRGEITFTADLSVRHDTKVDDVDVGSSSSSSSSYAERRRSFPGSGEGDGGALDPIHLSEGSAKKWRTRRLSRFRGSGHVSEPGYKNRQFLEGQLVVIGGGEYFSFAWVPLEYQIFFGRPSPELALKMLREGGGTSLTAGVGLDAPGPDANVRDMTEYAGRCLEVTCDVMCDESREGKVDPFSCIWHGDDDEYCYFE